MPFHYVHTYSMLLCLTMLQEIISTVKRLFAVGL